MQQTEAIDALKFAWSGEIYGMAFFQYFICHASQRREVWETLYQIECLTENYLCQHLAGLITISQQERDALQKKGIQEASCLIELSWETLCSTMCDWVEPWQKKYRDWQHQMQQWQDEFTVIYLHETAIADFWDKMMRNDERAYQYLQADFVRLQSMMKS